MNNLKKNVSSQDEKIPRSKYEKMIKDSLSNGMLCAHLF